ncbi:hypothetical protein [Marinitenerispora sediminis]|nr:hypothetical protein [Marinitenerispora sediminis]
MHWIRIPRPYEPGDIRLINPFLTPDWADDLIWPDDDTPEENP